MDRSATKPQTTKMRFRSLPHPRLIRMNVANPSLLNAILLIALGAAGYFLPADPSPTALIPVVFGIGLLICQPGIRKHNKTVAHIAVLLTLLILVGLAMPLRGAIGREDTAAIGRVTIMLLSTALALGMFVKSFIDARKQREAEIATAAMTESSNE